MNMISTGVNRISTQNPVLFLLLFAVLLGGCASVNFDYPKQMSTAVVDTDDTYLGRETASRPPQHPGESGFYLLEDGIEALAARLLAADRAERTVVTRRYPD